MKKRNEYTVKEVLDILGAPDFDRKERYELDKLFPRFVMAAKEYGGELLLLIGLGDKTAGLIDRKIRQTLGLSSDGEDGGDEPQTAVPAAVEPAPAPEPEPEPERRTGVRAVDENVGEEK